MDTHQAVKHRVGSQASPEHKLVFTVDLVEEVAEMAKLTLVAVEVLPATLPTAETAVQVKAELVMQQVAVRAGLEEPAEAVAQAETLAVRTLLVAVEE